MIRPLPALSLACVAILASGCSRTASDNSKVLANVSGVKITEKGFEASARALITDTAEVEKFLKEPARKDERADLLGSLAETKALIAFAKKQGLDKGERARLLLERAEANAYMQLLMDARSSKLEPKDEELRKLFDERVAAMKAAGQSVEGVPPFEQVRPQVLNMWKQSQMAKVQEQLKTEIKQQVPVTFAEGMQPRQQ